MSKKTRFRPSIQQLDSRKLMAGDAFGVTGVDDPTVDGNQSTTVLADPGVGITQPGIIAKPAEPVAAVAVKHFDPVVGIDVHSLGNDSIWMDLGYPVRVADSDSGWGGGILNDGGTLSVRAGGGIETNNGATDDFFADLGDDATTSDYLFRYNANTKQITLG